MGRGCWTSQPPVNMSCVPHVARPLAEWHHPTAQPVTLSPSCSLYYPLTLTGVLFVPWLAVWRMQMPMTRKWTEGRLTFTLTHRWRDEPEKSVLPARDTNRKREVEWHDAVAGHNPKSGDWVRKTAYYASVLSLQTFTSCASMLDCGNWVRSAVYNLCHISYTYRRGPWGAFHGVSE